MTPRQTLCAELLALADAAPLTPPPPVLGEGAPVDRLRAYSAHDAGALATLDDLLADDAPADAPTTLERVRRLIQRTERRALNAADNRYGTYAGVLERLYARERLLVGAPPPREDAVLAALRGLDGETIAAIEATTGDLDKAYAARLAAVRAAAPEHLLPLVDALSAP